jgi:adenylosuccinate synthase
LSLDSWFFFLEKFLKKLLGRNDVEDGLKRLDKLTQEEAKMATAEVLKITRGMDSNMKVLIDGAQTRFL